MKRIFCIVWFLATLFTPAAHAHPHVFIDAGVHFIFDDKGQLAAVRVIWVYDEFYSLLMIEDRGMDADGDGILTNAEKRALAGTDVAWQDGFPGDIEVRLPTGEIIELAGPYEHMADYKDGRVITTHIRPLKTRFRPDETGIIAKVFDPTYFVAYDMQLDPKIEGDTGCGFQIDRTDIRAAMAKVDKEYFGSGAKEYAPDDYPEVGELFADTVILSCAPY